VLERDFGGRGGKDQSAQHQLQVIFRTIDHHPPPVFVVKMEQIAQQFTDFYYSTFDADRNQLVNLYVRPSATPLSSSTVDHEADVLVWG
jgi:hypothetical protein